jgi:uncharacterized protein (DUF488 family)
MTTLYTVGHSTRSAPEFREILQAHGIESLVDVRQFPGSRRYPHFGSAALAASLADAGIAYCHEVNLGGRRRSRPDSANLYWHNASFRGFADYMAGSQFGAALERLIERSGQRKTAIMCAEAVPWRCHRWLISDALVSRNIDVVHILDANHSQPHVLNPQAHVDARGTLTYPFALGNDAR